jgi:hypothetical protein
VEVKMDGGGAGNREEVGRGFFLLILLASVLDDENLL